MRYLIGIDIGGTNLRAALISKDGNIKEIFKIKNEVSNGAQYNLDKIITHIKNEWKQYQIESVGVGAPGPLNLKEGIILNPPNLKGWENFNIKKYLRDNLDLPVNVNNDANVAGLAEALAGSAKGCESLFYITVSTGVGGALILNGHIVNGAHSQCAEIYNMIINEDKYSQNGLNKGGLEGQCSGVNISRLASDLLNREITTKEVFDLYKSNNEIAVKIINKWIDNIAIAVADIITVVDPETVVIGGAVLINNPYLISKIENAVKLKTADPSIVDIRIAKFKDNAGLIGAAML